MTSPSQRKEERKQTQSEGFFIQSETEHPLANRQTRKQDGAFKLRAILTRDDIHCHQLALARRDKKKTTKRTRTAIGLLLGCGRRQREPFGNGEEILPFSSFIVRQLSVSNSSLL